jgi:hypothetical protein
MVRHTLERIALAGAVAVVMGAAGCSVGGETCGLGRCYDGSQCVTLFKGTFTSKAAGPGSDIDHNYWCLGPCHGKTCSGQCMQDPADDSVVVCAGNKVEMSLSCPTTLEASVDGACTSFTTIACAAGGVTCAAGKVCSMGTLSAGTVIGPIGVSVQEQNDPVVLDTSALAHTTDANPPLSDALPQGVTPQINVPTSCTN